MNWNQIVKIYAEVNGVTAAEVEKDVDEGWITRTMLFEAFLENEGIFDYTYKILEAIDEIDEHTVR